MEGQHRLLALEGEVDEDRSGRFGDELWTDANVDHRAARCSTPSAGHRGVVRMVEGLLQRVLSDRVLASAFAREDMTPLVAAQVRFFAQSFGGEHADALVPVAMVRLTGEQFDRFVLHLSESFASLGLPQPVTEQRILAAAARTLADPCA
jgi:truncated hemoglobin YjbI